MYCSYHPGNPARVQCSSCSRSLCAACDHRIKGSAYCQDCIVLGIESLPRNHHRTNQSKGRARLAALCALLPGMGAVFNRQNVKAVVHFITVMGIFQLARFDGLEGVFVLGGILFYLYTIVDAYRTAQSLAQGESPAADEERFKQSLTRRAPAVGLILIVAGLLLVIQILHPFNIVLSLARLLPVMLIIMGGYLLTRYFKRSRGSEQPRDYSERPPYQLVPGAFRGRDARPSGSGRASHPFDRR